MDTELVKRGLEFTRKRKKWIIVLGLIGFSSYGAYKVYHKPSVVRKRQRILKLFGAMVSVAEVVSDSAETIDVVSKDLKQFLNSNSDEIPNSLKQLSKITRSDEVSESLTRVFQALTVGILSGYNKVERDDSELQEMGNSNFCDRVMDRLMSSSGTGFVSVIVGSFARNLVLGFYANNGSSSSSSSTDDANAESELRLGSSGWLSLITDDKCRVLIADCIKTFVRTAVDVYLGKTMDINTYDEVFSGLTNPKHQNKMKDILVSLCNGAVETLVKTSHQVLTTSSKQNLIMGSNDSCLVMDQREDELVIKRDIVTRDYDASEPLTQSVSVDLGNNGWVNSVSSTLSVPSNRKFVLDVTGRVMFETVRSLMEFFVQKASEGLKKSLNAVHDEAADRGFEIVRFIGAKSSVILTICFALLLHILGNTRVLLSA